MQNKSKKIVENILSRTKIYIAIIFILLLIISIENPIMIIPAIIIFIIIAVYSYSENIKKKSEISETLQNLTLTVDSAAKTSLTSSPFPLIIIETNGNITWKNENFQKEFEDVDINSYLTNLILDIKVEIQKRKEQDEKTILRHIEINKKYYEIVGKFVDSKENAEKKEKEYVMILYFINETENVILQEEYKNSKSCVTIIIVDNYEETMQQLESEEKPQVIAEIDKCIYDWADKTNGVLIKSDRDRYIYLFEQRYLEKVKEDKFSILDKIKEIETKENIQLTLSIAVSNDGITDKEKYKSAQEAMDLVLGRGGDQAVIRENEIYKFYGGRVQEVEKRTKVKARVVAHALENLITASSKVMIMGHTNSDIDAMGSALGVYRFATNLDKEAYILTDFETASIKEFIENIQEDYKEVLVNKETALSLIDNETLLIVVDTHKTSYVEEPELLNKTNKIVVIDHHRRGTDFIEQSILTFQEVYASSASELVTELLQYTQKEVELQTIEAEALYAGIMMDTKNFTFKTGVRTFEAAAYLRRCGVDIIKVKKWFQSDLESYNKISEIVRNAEIIYETIGISTYEVQEKDTSLICAKAADELLTIGNITASFVLGTMDDKITISGRSIGDINVQMILEKLGGGGHITLAGAQLENKTIEEAKELLIEKTEEYFSEKE